MLLTLCCEQYYCICRLMNVSGIAVIVSRWFGGILLGPERFKFILNSARKVIEDNMPYFGEWQSNNKISNNNKSIEKNKHTKKIKNLS